MYSDSSFILFSYKYFFINEISSNYLLIFVPIEKYNNFLLSIKLNIKYDCDLSR